MRPFSLHRGDEHRDLAGTVLCHDVPGAFRKGHVLGPEDIPRLIAAGWTELHLIELGPDDVGQREAAARLGEILVSDGLRVATGAFRCTLKATHNGLVKIDVAALQRMNRIPGIVVFTLRNDEIVAADQTVAEAQITPLAIDRNALDEAAREERVIENVGAKLRWYGCTVRVSREPFRCVDDGALHIVSGSNPLDPLDPVFVELERANVQRVGLPVHPGTLLWIASFKADLVVLKTLAEGGIRDEEIAALGHGGILNFARERTLAQEHEPVR